MAQVHLNAIGKRFGTTVAVDDLSLDVQDGEFVSLLGPSGCGKTTTLRIIAGFIEPTRGVISIGGTVYSDPGRGIFVPPEQRKLGMVFQSYAVWPHMNVFENIAYPLRIRKMPKTEIRDRVNRVAEQVKMPELLDRYPSQLSGGQQQRVALARALAAEPRVLLLDEPLSNLDAKLREEMRLEIKELQSRLGITIVFVTHDQVEAMVLSDRIAVINQGRLLQVGTPQSIYEQPADEFVARFIGAANLLPIDESGAHVRGDSDFELPVRAGGGRAVVRPEDIEVETEASTDHAAARVETSMYMGNQVLCFLTRGDHRIVARLTRRMVPEPGQQLYLKVREAAVVRQNIPKDTNET